MELICHVISIILVFGLTEASSEVEHSIHYNLNYPYVLSAAYQQVEGRICSDMELYALIPIEPRNVETLVGGACVTRIEKYLRLIVREVSWFKKTPRSTTTTTTINPPHHEPGGTTRQPVPGAAIDLPHGVDFDVIHTNLIDVDDAYYLTVSKPDVLRQKHEVQFYVVLINVTSYAILSNPLPFAVRIDRDPNQVRPHGAAVFAGVLVLAIVLIALLIPVTVCVKRRRKAGKPVCNCGKSSADDKEEVKGRSNQGYVETRDSRSDSNGSSNPQQTIASHQLSSVSNMRFTPTWLDPHYKDHDRSLYGRRSIDQGIEIKVESPSESECRL